MFSVCPCVSARAGAFILTGAVWLTFHAPVVFGRSFGDLLGATLAGDIGPGFAVWSFWVAVGIWQLVRGLQAAVDHADPIRWRSLAWSVGVIAFVVWFMPGFVAESATDGLAPAELQFALAVLLSWAASEAVNIGLQLRGVFGVLCRPFVRRRDASGIQPDPLILALYQRYAAHLRQVEAERDRLARELAQRPEPARGDLFELVTVLGGRRKLLASVHPDRIEGEAEKRLATERFQKLAALLEQAGVR